MADVINDRIVKNSIELGATTETITHDTHSARKIADKVAMIYEGKIIWFGDIKDIDNSKNKYLEQFIAGSSNGPINFLKYINSLIIISQKLEKQQYQEHSIQTIKTI